MSLWQCIEHNASPNHPGDININKFPINVPKLPLPLATDIHATLFEDEFYRGVCRRVSSLLIFERLVADNGPSRKATETWRGSDCVERGSVVADKGSSHGVTLRMKGRRADRHI